MALSKEDIKFFKEMANDMDIPADERAMYQAQIDEAEGKKSDTPKSTPKKKSTTKKKATAKKKTTKDIETLKAEIKKRTGKTEEECEKIVAEYKALRTKATKRKKKEKEQSDQSKKRVTKLKKEKKVIEGTTEKNVKTTIDDATEKVTKKIDKQIDKEEKAKTKTPQQIKKAIDKIVKDALKSSEKFIGDISKSFDDKDDARTYLMGMRKKIDDLLKKYEYGGEIFDGSGDSVNYGSGGMTQQLNIQEGLISLGNNSSTPSGASPSWAYAHGGKTQGYNDRGDEELGMRDGRERMYRQSMKDRRDEMKGENRAVGNRTYGSFKKGGKTDFVEKVVDSPKFRKGAFTKKAKERGMTPEQFQNEVLSNPKDYDLRTRRQAQFMKNAFNI